MTIPAGTRLGRYEIVAPLGAGGMGEVYRARDTRLDREVAIKVLAQHLGSHPDVRARFEREAKTISSLDHPHLCTLFDVGREGDTDFLVMELLEGETLAARLARGALPEGEVTKLGAQIADALACAHRAGVVHRDLKPGNVMLTRSGAKLLDFGLARATASVIGPTDPPDALSASPTASQPLTAEGTLVGTFQYMSPEQLEGREADARSDLWGLGCVLYEMATGRRAFEGPSRAALIAAILEREPAPISSLRPSASPALDRLVQACLAKHPDDRIQTAQDVKLQLEWLRADSAASGGAAAPLARAPRRALLVLVGSLVLLTAAVAAGFFAGRRAAPPARTPDPADIQRRTFRSQAVFAARFLNDAKTLVLSAAPSGNRPRLFVLGADSPEPRPVGPEDVHLLAVSSRGELAVLDHARYTGHHRLFEGTLSRMPLEGAAPRPLMDNVREADWSPDGKDLAVIHEVAGKDRLEYPIGKVLYESAGYLSDVRVSPRGDAIAFMEHPQRWDDRGSVSVVDARGKARVLASGYASMQGLAWAPGGKALFFSATENGSEYLVYEAGLDGGTSTPSRRLGFVTLHDVAPDGTWAATHDEIPTRVLYRRAGSDAETDLSWLDSANQPSLSDDGRTLALVDQSVLAGAHYSAVVRPTSGGPIVRLGEGVPEEFSPDGRSVVAIVPSTPPRIVSYPLGTGAATRLDPGGFENVSCVRWMPEGKRLLLCGNLPQQASRCFVLDPASRRASAVGPDGLWECFPSPEGSRFAARASDGWLLCSVSGEPAPKPIPGMRPTDEVIRWDRDGTALYCFERGAVPSNVDRIDLATGRRRTVTVVGDRDAAGMLAVLSVSMTDDLKSLVYGSSTRNSTLYTVSRGR